MQKGRRKKIRYIQKMPKILQFSPRGKPGRPDEIELKVDEYEAIKLADLQGYDQSEGAMAMGISRPSFGRILRNGRRVIADALVKGKIIRPLIQVKREEIEAYLKERSIPYREDESNLDRRFLRNTAEHS